MKNKENKLYKILLCVSIIFVLVFMFVSLNSDFSFLYNILESLGQKQIFNKSLLLSDYVYTGNLYIINPGLLITLFGNNLIIKLIVTVLLAIIYIFLVYKISDRYLNKYQKMILLLILLCGISKDYMLSIFLYNSFIYNVIISLGIFYFCIRLFYENKIPKIIIFAILIFLLGINSFYNLYSIMIPYIIVELFFKNKNSGFKCYSKLIILLFLILFLYLFFLFLFNNYSFIIMMDNSVAIGKRIFSILDVLINIFGISGGQDLISISRSIYFYNNFSYYSLISIYGITVLLRFVFMVFTVIVAPIILIINKNKNDININKLALFNIISLILNIAFYVILGTFAYDITDIKYFLFNYIIMFIIDVYVVNKYLVKYDFMKKIITLFFVLFIIFNIMTNLIYIN